MEASEVVVLFLSFVPVIVAQGAHLFWPFWIIERTNKTNGKKKVDRG